MHVALLELEEWSAATVVARLSELAEIYSEVYAEPPYNSGPLWSAESFIDRTRRQTERAGFLFEVALADNEICGFSFGLPFGTGSWWSGDATPPPEKILETSKFAVIELVVRRPWRGRGIGRQLIERLLSHRAEKFAILTAMPDAPAREIYRHWGWTEVGTARHTPDSPLLDALALALPAGPSTEEGRPPRNKE